MSTQADADRNLLFGTLAVQMGFISRDQLADAMAEWARDRAGPVGDILRQKNVLAEDELRLLEAMVAKHLVRHDGDVARSLAAVSPDPSIREALSQATDQMGQTSLGHGPPPKPRPPVGATDVDAYATRAATVTGGGPAGGDSGPTVRDGRFKVIRPHARGGLGEVFVARDGELNREVALKEIQDVHADHPESRSRFVLEAEITGALEHPGIVPVYGLGTYPDGRPYYAMRFIRGDSLQDAIKRFHEAEGPARDPGERALALRGLLRRFIDICHALAYAHSRGVIHRDIKPGNVMLGQFGETLVVDWGLAKPLAANGVPEHLHAHLPLSIEGPVVPSTLGQSSPTYIGMAVGTPQYMSPEQAAGRIDELGPASDIYSLGATLYCLLVGKPPLDQVEISELLIRAQRADVPPARDVNPAVPPALSAVCRKAMALMPEERYPTARALADDVERWLADEPTTAWAEPWAVRARRWAGRHRTGVTTAAAVVVVGGFCLGVATVLLTAANRRERKAKDEAAANYRLARDAVDRYHTEVSEEVLLNEPGMEPLRRRLLGAAREFYAKFADRRTDDPEVKAELGRALYRLAQITADVEGPAKGIELHQQALAIFTGLVAARPNEAELLADQAACLHHLGRLQRETDQLAAAGASYQGALALWLKLEVDHPDEERYRAEEARTRLGIGNVEQFLRRLGPARDETAQALAIREKLAAAHPERADYARDLATTRHNLAVIQTYAGPADQAEENFKLAQAAQEELVNAAPHVTQYQADLARTHINRGALYQGRKQFDRAIAEFQASADKWAQLATKHPTVAKFRTGEAKAYLYIARCQWNLRRDDLAEEALKKAQDFYHLLGATVLQVPSDRADVAGGYRQLGDLYRSARNQTKARAAYQTALDLLEPLTAGPGAPPEYVAELASIWNNLGLLEKTDGKRALAEVAFRKAAQLWEGLVESHPENPDYAEGLKATKHNLNPLNNGGTQTVTFAGPRGSRARTVDRLAVWPLHQIRD